METGVNSTYATAIRYKSKKILLLRNTEHIKRIKQSCLKTQTSCVIARQLYRRSNPLLSEMEIASLRKLRSQ
jgi:hypothetical protein